jgi:hypothetical protein
MLGFASTEILEMPALCGSELLVLLDHCAIYLNNEMNSHAVKGSWHPDQDPEFYVVTIHYC